MEKIIIILCVAWHSSLAQFPVAPDVVYDFIKSNSIYRNKEDWGQIDNQFFSTISTAHNLQDTMNAFMNVFQALGDVNSQVYFNNRYYGYGYPDKGNDETRLSKLLDLATEKSGQVKCDLLENHFAYIRVPAFNAYGPDEVNQYARSLPVCSKSHFEFFRGLCS